MLKILPLIPFWEDTWVHDWSITLHGREGPTEVELQPGDLGVLPQDVSEMNIWIFDQ